MNIAEIAGHLGADAEERFTGTGKRVVSLRVAAKVRQGGKDETVWWRVNLWGDRFDRLIPYLKKGSGVIIIGDMAKPETYVDRNGQTQVSMTLNAEIVKFSPFGRNNQQDGSSGSGFSAASTSSATPATPAASAEEGEPVAFGAGQAGYSGDDLPF